MVKKPSLTFLAFCLLVFTKCASQHLTVQRGISSEGVPAQFIVNYNPASAFNIPLMNLAQKINSDEHVESSESWKDVEWKLQNKEPRNIEDFLSLLSPTYKSFNVLVYDSRSAQHSTSTKPRAIMFGEDASIIMSFEGSDPSQDQARNNRVEVIHLSEDRSAWLFKTIQFSNDAPATVFEHKIGTNRSSCFLCHNGGPIWDVYPLWPGVYGKDTDLIRNDLPQYLAFLQSAQTDKRYLALGPNPESLSLMKVPQVDASTNQSSIEWARPLIPNNLLSQKLTESNQKMMVRDLVNLSFSKAKALTKLLFSCNSISETEKTKLAAIEADVRSDLNRYFEELKKRDQMLVTSTHRLGRFTDKQKEIVWLIKWILYVFQDTNFNLQKYNLAFDTQAMESMLGYSLGTAKYVIFNNDGDDYFYPEILSRVGNSEVQAIPYDDVSNILNYSTSGMCNANSSSGYCGELNKICKM